MKIAEELVKKHRMLEKFLQTIGVDEEYIYQDVQGIEHHISQKTTFCISSLFRFFEDHPHIKESLSNYRDQLDK
jgi:Mn-dependent DtxR family transcriptional regulator